MLPFDTATTAAQISTLMARPGCTRIVVADLPNEEYHRCAALSRSSLVKLMRSPAHYIAGTAPDPTLLQLDDAEPVEDDKPQLAYGSLVHMLALQPALAASHYVVGPPVKTRAAKAWKEALLGIPSGCEMVHPADFKRATAQAAVIRSNPIFAEHAARPLAWSELSMFWRDTVTGEWLMCRPDSLACIGIEGEVTYGIEVIDLKTTADASAWAFSGSCQTFRYDAQVAFYWAGIERACGLPVHKFLIMASESKWPFVTELYDMVPKWIDAAAEDCRQAIDRYARCKASNSWPAYSDGSVQPLGPPRWREREIDIASV